MTKRDGARPAADAGKGHPVDPARAEALIHKYRVAAGVVGVIPAPLFDQIVVGGLLGKMIYDLGRLYGVKVQLYRTKAIIAAVLGGAHAEWVPRYVLGYLSMLVPVAGVYGAFVLRPATAVAVVSVIGRIFDKQFAKGRTVATMDVAEAKREAAALFHTPKATSVAVVDARLQAELEDGRSISAPLSWFPTVAEAAQERRARVELSGDGWEIRWPDLGFSVSLAQLIEGRPA